jgi:hypothetical protein
MTGEKAGFVPNSPRIRCLSIAVACALGTVLPVSAGDPPSRTRAQTVTSDHSAALSTLGVTSGDVQALALPASVGDGLLVDVVLGGAPRTLRLEPHSVRSAGFQLIEVGADGVHRALVPPPPSTVRGEVLGLPGSLVAGALRDGSLTVQVLFDDGRDGWAIEPLPGSPLHVAYRSDALLPDFEQACAMVTVPEVGHSAGSTESASLAGPSTFPFLSADLAIDVDVESFMQLGSVVAAEDHVETIINAVSALYESFAGIRIDIPIIVVRTAEPDPYTKVNPSLLLDEVRAAWIDAGPGVEFDFVQLFRGKNLPGVAGVASGGVCGAYLFSSVVETFSLPAFKKKVAISAHELGHLFSTPHCQAGTPGCGIMCSSLCGPPDKFDAGSVQSLLLSKFSAACLDFVDQPLPPLIVDVTPKQTQSFNPGWIRVTGQGFTMTSAVEVDGEPMNPFFVRVFADEELQFRPPVPDALGPLDVSIIAPGGHSTMFHVTVTGNSPPILNVDSVILAGQPMSWVWGGPEGHTAVLFLSLSERTVTPSGIEQLADVVRWIIQPLDAQGLGGTSIAAVPAGAEGLEFYSQIMTFDGHGHSDRSSIKSTTVFSLP